MFTVLCWSGNFRYVPYAAESLRKGTPNTASPNFQHHLQPIQSKNWGMLKRHLNCASPIATLSTVCVTSTFTSRSRIIAIHILKRIGRLPNNSCLSCLVLLRERIFSWLSFRLESTKKSQRKTATLYLIYWSAVTRLPSSFQIEVHKSSEVVSMNPTYSLKVMQITHSCSFHNIWSLSCYTNETQHFHFTT